MIDPILRVSLEVQPFAQPLVGAAAREVAFLRVENDVTGRVGFGECAPLRGVHRETLDDSLAALEDWLDGIRETDDLPPSAAFAASCAIATGEGFGSGIARDADVAALHAGGVAELTDVELARLRGTKSLKLKIGRAAPAEERALIARALEGLPGVRLRLDGNRRLSLADCIDLLRGIDPAHVEYLEEPIANPAELGDLADATGMTLALDELVADRGREARLLREELARSKRVSAWVLRMSAIGSLDAIYDTAEEAARLGSDVVLSTAFESSYSLRLAVHLAASIPNARRPHGLGTAHVLLGDACASAAVCNGVLAGGPLPVPFAEAWS